MEEVQEAMTTKTNDIYMILFLSSLIRTVVSLHDLVKVKEESLTKKTKEEPTQISESSDSE